MAKHVMRIKLSSIHLLFIDLCAINQYAGIIPDETKRHKLRLAHKGASVAPLCTSTSLLLE